jgi:hypothetical protein
MLLSILARYLDIKSQQSKTVNKSFTRAPQRAENSLKLCCKKVNRVGGLRLKKFSALWNCCGPSMYVGSLFGLGEYSF